MNIDHNRMDQTPPLHDGQGHWWSQPTTAADTHQKKRVRRRGNRKLQRFRARLRRRGYDVETITTLMNKNSEDSFPLDMEREVHIPLNDQVTIKDFSYKRIHSDYSRVVASTLRCISTKQINVNERRTVTMLPNR
jgi:hypothetical protein